MSVIDWHTILADPALNKASLLEQLKQLEAKDSVYNWKGPNNSNVVVCSQSDMSLIKNYNFCIYHKLPTYRTLH
jgi:hypothetical protein